MNICMVTCEKNVNWDSLVELFRIAPLGKRIANDLKKSFTNSMFKCFLYDGEQIIAAGRALADGVDCSYLCDIVVHPDYQGIGLGKVVVESLIAQSQGHNKIILFANVGKEPFYAKLGFKKMNTAMAIFKDEKTAIDKGVISP
ncbi:GNAT family N-acetyltransferase [Lentisphaerota bacterium WC36G]|nr:GNAT family N-acetyltransferase [Lentisphaerae bacterium WC36]